MRELDSWQRRIGRWLLRDHRAPDAVVLGDLGWRPWSSLAVERAISLCCRLSAQVSLRPSAIVGDVSRGSGRGWVQSVEGVMRAAGAVVPQSFYAWPRTSLDRRSLLQSSIRPFLEQEDLAHWLQHLAFYTDEGLQFYGNSVPQPQLAPVHSSSCPPRCAAAWCRMRHGGSTIPSHRGTRHRRNSNACHLCNSADGSLGHALLQCPHLSDARLRWWQSVHSVSPVDPLGSQACRDRMVQWFFSQDLPPRVAAANAVYAYHIECAYGDIGARAS